MTVSPLNILLIGFGNMGRALYQGWQSQNHTIIVVDPALEEGEGHFNTVTDQVRNFTPDLIVLAVKPQITPQVLADYEFLKGTPALVLSIMAGVPMAIFTDFFGQDMPVIRSMPNLPALVAKGITTCVANANVKQTHRIMVDDVLGVVGQVTWVDDEELMHAVTAVSGSGPAYVFHMIEAMTAAAIKVGLTDKLAEQLARETVIGSAVLIAQSDKRVDVLRAKVTSPAGTTQSALDVLMKEEGGLTDLMTKAILNATQRSKDLG